MAVTDLAEILQEDVQHNQAYQKENQAHGTEGFDTQRKREERQAKYLSFNGNESQVKIDLCNSPRGSKWLSDLNSKRDILPRGVKRPGLKLEIRGSSGRRTSNDTLPSSTPSAQLGRHSRRRDVTPQRTIHVNHLNSDTKPEDTATPPMSVRKSVQTRRKIKGEDTICVTPITRRSLRRHVSRSGKDKSMLIVQDQGSATIPRARTRLQIAISRTSKYATRTTNTIETPVHKVISDKKAALPPTSISVGGTSPSSQETRDAFQHNASDSVTSSPLTTPPSSPQLLALNNTIDTAVETVQREQVSDNFEVASFVPNRKKFRGITPITVLDADTMSIPPPGPKLQVLVEEAKQRLEIPKLHDTSVLRFVKGKWMVPQKCDSCQTSRTRACNGKLPCSTCIDEGLNCTRGTLMRTVMRSRMYKAKVPRKDERHTPVIEMEILSLSPHIYQNIDGTWGTVSTTDKIRPKRHTKRKAVDVEGPIPSPKIRIRLVCKLPREVASPSSAIFSDHVYQQNDGSWSLGFHQGLEPHKGRRKRKANALDDDMDLGPACDLSTPKQVEIMTDEPFVISPELVAPKRRSTGGKKSSGYIKYHKSVQDDKPEPYGKPPVWADKRQNLCETLPYYRAYMSGAYMSDGQARAFMVDKEVGIRDKLDEEILIARVGGGRKLDEETGQMIQKADQSRSAFACGFRRAQDQNAPVAVIAGQGNKISPSKLPHYYNILGWFQVTDVWCEKSSGLKCWMVRLEKIDLNEKSWWAAMNSPPLDPARNIEAAKTFSAGCRICKTESKAIYNMGWTCLDTSCTSYFKFNRDYRDTDLDFVEEFLKERTVYTGTEPDPLAPPLPTDEEVERRGGAGIEKEYKVGIVCPKCNGCSRRIAWSHWTCETEGCDFTHRILQKPIKVSQAIADSVTTVAEICDENFGIRVRQSIMGQYNVFDYIMPGENGEAVGVVRHFRANGIINVQPDGPNDLFLQMQEKDFGLKRHPARQKGSTGEVLTSHWAANWGAPYKYGVSVLSRGFEEAPPVIIKALKRLTWAGEQVVTEKLEPFHPFNELLSIGYFEDTSIGYHDDGESTLGPTVATLSLGSAAVMSLRPKAKAKLGPNSKNAKGTKPDVLKFVLYHGDLVVMHGPGVQKYYEHAVTPQGKLRFALTCRYVRPELLPSDAERCDAAVKAKLPHGHEAFTYDGDIGKTFTSVTDELTPVQNAFNTTMGSVIAGEVSREDMIRMRDFLNEVMSGLPSHANESDVEDV